MSSLQFLYSPFCNSAFGCTVFTRIRNESEVIPDRVRTGSHSGSKLSIQWEILSRNHINGDRNSFRKETGSCPGQRMRSLVFLLVFCCSFALSLLSWALFEYEFDWKYSHVNMVPNLFFIPDRTRSCIM